MVFDRRPYTFDRVVRLALTAGLLWGLIWLLGYLSDVLIPFAIALLLAYLINPLVDRVQKKVRNHRIAVFLSLFLVMLGLAVVGLLVVPLMVQEVRHISQVFSDLVGKTTLSERAAEILPQNIWGQVEDFIERPEVQKLFQSDKLVGMAEGAIRKLLPGIWGVITGTATVLFGVLALTLVLLYLVFLLLDYQRLREGWKALIPEIHRDAVLGFIAEFNQAMNRYFRGQAAVAFLVGVLFSLGFLIIGLPMAVLFGLFVGLLNMVPYLQVVSMPIALVLAAVRAVETGTNIWAMLGLTALVYAVVQAIQDSIIVPKIMGRVTGFSPAMILLSLSIWGKLLGMFGLIIALPMTALVVAYYKRFIVAAPKLRVVEEEPSTPPPVDQE
jgi:predicted PurR-regulated permease PerM